MIHPSRSLFVAALVVLTVLPASARELCSSLQGHLRIRERCRRHETRIDLREFLADPVPLRDWIAPPERSDVEGLEAVAAAPDSTLLDVDPCRLIDTRPGFASAFVGDDIGAFTSFEERSYQLTGLCNIPSGATALSINLAIVPGPSNGFVTVGPGGSIPPFPPGPSFSSINFQGAGPAISNSLIVPLDDTGTLEVYAARTANVIIDTNGYFRPKDSGTNVFFVPGTDTPIANGDALDDAIAEIGALPVGTPVTLELGPGTFDLGTGGLDLTRPMRLEGAGASLTKITCDCEGASTFADGATIFVETNAAGTLLRDLHVENTGTTELFRDAIAFLSGDGLTAQRLRVTATGGRGVLLTAATGVALEDVTIETDGNAVSLGSGSSVTIRGSRVTSTGNNAILSLAATDMIFVENSTVETISATHRAIQHSPTVNGGSTVARHSELLTGGDSYAGGGGTLDMSHTIVNTAISGFTGTATCAATSNAGVFTATGCP